MADFSQLNELLLNQINCGQLSHAYIFRGQQAMDQALSLAANLNCPHADHGMPCGSCTVCRNILAGTIRIAISWSRIKVLTVWKE